MHVEARGPPQVFSSVTFHLVFEPWSLTCTWGLQIWLGCLALSPRDPLTSVLPEIASVYHRIQLLFFSAWVLCTKFRSSCLCGKCLPAKYLLSLRTVLNYNPKPLHTCDVVRNFNLRPAFLPKHFRHRACGCRGLCPDLILMDPSLVIEER